MDRGRAACYGAAVLDESDVEAATYALACIVAALFVDPSGPYANLEGVDPWDATRDARLYAGPWPVVAHPPCERWGRYAAGGPNASYPRKIGDDGGCFASALASVRRWGGVLEHPEASLAWKAFGIPAPPRTGGWIGSICGGWTCCVAQGHYGHRAQKLTWLYAFGVELRGFVWGPCAGKDRLEPGFHSAAERAAATDEQRLIKRLSGHERIATPPAFQAELLAMARTACR